MAKDIPVALPFDPNPRTPRWRLPDNACDTHFHVFGPPARFPYSPARRYEPPTAPIEHYFAMQKVTGLGRGVVVQPTAHGADNRAILDAIARSSGRLKGVAAIDASTTDAELAALAAGGIVGARFSLMSDRAGSRDAIEHAVPRMQALGWSLDLHIEPEHLLAQEAFVRALLVPGTELELGYVAMQWAGMPNKNERGITGEVLESLARTGFLQRLDGERFLVLRDAEA